LLQKNMHFDILPPLAALPHPCPEGRDLPRYLGKPETASPRRL
jgi:hypothetical protein